MNPLHVSFMQNRRQVENQWHKMIEITNVCIGLIDIAWFWTLAKFTSSKKYVIT
jgi:hypothetical protein